MRARTTLVGATALFLAAAVAGPAFAAGTATGARSTDTHAAARRAIQAAVRAGVPGVTATATGPTYDVTTLNPSIASSAGEMISDSADLDRFYSALLGGKLLPPRQLKEMKTTVKSQIPNSGYGLGLIDTTLSCGVHVWGHDGGIHGSASTAVTTTDGSHSLALNFNGDWVGDTAAVTEAEFCGK